MCKRVLGRFCESSARSLSSIIHFFHCLETLMRLWIAGNFQLRGVFLKTFNCLPIPVCRRVLAKGVFHGIGILMVLALVGCHSGRNYTHDASIGRTEEDFHHLVRPPNTHKPTKSMAPKVPTKEVSLPAEFSKEVSLDIDASMHVADVLRVLCDKADIPYVLASDLEGSLAYRAIKRPFHLVLEDICSTLQLAFSWEQGVLKSSGTVLLIVPIPYGSWPIRAKVKPMCQTEQIFFPEVGKRLGKPRAQDMVRDMR